MITNQYTGEMYFTRRETEFMGLPVGNAFRGAPFKKKEMPFFIAPAIAGIGAATGFAATALAVVNAVGVVAMVAGTAMTVVGAVTGDKDLMKIGGVVGLAGGVASLAAGGIAGAMAGSSGIQFGTSGIEALNTSMAQTASSAGTGAATAAANGVAAQVDKVLPAMELTETAANLTTQGLSGSTGGMISQQTAGNVLGSGAQFSSYVAPEVVTNSIAAPTSSLGNIAGTGAATSLSTGLSSQLGSAASTAIGGTASTAASTGGGFFDSMLGGMTGSEKGMVLGGAMQLLKGFGDDSQERQIQANLEVAKLNADTRIKEAEMQVGVADRRLAAEKEANAQKAENMNFQPTMTWTVSNKNTGVSKTLGSGSVISGAK